MRIEAKIYIIFVFVATLLLGSAEISAAYPREISGLVCDSLTGEHLGYANIYIVGGNSGCVSNDDGYFRLHAQHPVRSIEVSCLGYARKRIEFENDSAKDIVVRLRPTTAQLKEFVVHKTKNKYSKKNNPAVDFMERIRKAYPKHDPAGEPYYSYDLYEKKVLGLSDFTLPSVKSGMGRKMAFMSEYMDSVPTSSRQVLKISLREKSEKVLSRKGKGEKRVVLGKRSVGLDKSFNQENINMMLDEAFREIDIFGNDMTLMTNRFVSPLSNIAANYYKFYLDTVVQNGEKMIELSFVPHSPESFGMNGRMYVAAADTTMTVRSLEMRVPQSINLNYVKNLYVNQRFERDSLGNRHKVLDDMTVELQLMPGTQGFYARRLNDYSGFSYVRQPEHDRYFVETGNVFEAGESGERDSEFWAKVRMTQLTDVERNMGSFLSRIRQIPFFYWSEKILSVLVNGYISTGKNSKFDFGPVNTTVSYNSTEGVRFRLGGMTTSNLSEHIFLRGYAAYGLRDRKFKYDLRADYSFDRKKLHSQEFPMNLMSVEHKYDVDMIGQHYLFTNQDNVFLSLKRKSSNLTTYRRLSQLRYVREYRNNLSFEVGFRHEIQEATRWLDFRRADGAEDHSYRLSTFNVNLRWAPGEKFLQKRGNRINVNMDAPVFMLTHEYGPKGFLGSDFTMNKTEIMAFKRFWFSAFGYADLMVKGGIIWSGVPYPALAWQNANTSYTIQPESYSLMNPMEFAMDQYASLDLTYFGNGILFNRIPALKKLKLREVMTFKGLFGKLTDKNNPEKNKSLYEFPKDARTGRLGKTPYMEIGVGVDNILTFLRVDYVWRLTYRDRPDIDRSGVRVSLHFTF